MARVGYQKIAADLREAIRSGRYRPGQRLPSEEDLRQTYGVATHTARRAVALLRTEGLAEVVFGSGTFVREAAQREPVRIGRKAVVTARPATAEEAARFDLEPGAWVLVVRQYQVDRVYPADGYELHTG